jgi:hypothetical protein
VIRVKQEERNGGGDKGRKQKEKKTMKTMNGIEPSGSMKYWKTIEWPNI